jgi:hypothetical protein
MIPNVKNYHNQEETKSSQETMVKAHPVYKVQLSGVLLTCCTIAGATMWGLCNDTSQSGCSEGIKLTGQILFGIGVTPLAMGTCCLVALCSIGIISQSQGRKEFKEKIDRLTQKTEQENQRIKEIRQSSEELLKMPSS